MDGARLGQFLRAIQVVSSPKRMLSGYGTTRIEYHLVSPVEDLAGKTRLREGAVVSERPLILTPEVLKDRFDGFGEESLEFARWLTEEYRELLRVLEYRFLNKDLRARLLTDDSRSVVTRIRQDLEGRPHPEAVLIHCPDPAWSLALMKFTLDETARAFPGHVKSFEEHGLFDPVGTALRRQKAEVESIFPKARQDPGARSQLGRKLKEYGLFEEYEDRYLGLFR